MCLVTVVLGLPLTAADGLNVRPQATPYLSLPPAAPIPNGALTAAVAFPYLTFQGAIAVRPVPGTNRLWVLEREGRIWSFENDPSATSKTLVLDLNDDNPTDATPNTGHLTGATRWWCQGWDDCGLMGLAFHPDFGVPLLPGGSANPNRGYFYISYEAKSIQPAIGAGPSFRPNSGQGGNNNTDGANFVSNRVARFTLPDDSSAANPNSEQILIDQPDRHLWHNGGDLFFDNAGYLYCVNGDEGSAYDPYQNSQRINKGLFSGAMRIDVDWTAGSTRSHAPPARQAGQPTLYTGYGIPNDNPFVGIPGVLEEFFCLGLRSPHRMTYDTVTGWILVGDIGQGQREEVSHITAGANHQWGYLEGFGNDTVDPTIKNERAPPTYRALSLATTGVSTIALTYTAPTTDTTLPPGMLAAGDLVRFGDQVRTIQNLTTYPYSAVTLTTSLSQDVPADTAMIRTTGFIVAAITGTTGTNDNIPSGRGTTTLSITGSGVLSVGLCVAFPEASGYGSFQIISTTETTGSTTSITVRPALPVTPTIGSWIDRLTVIGTEQPPIADFNHGGTFGFNAIIGGYIYRGPAHPNLVGTYIFADNPRGTIYGMTGYDTMTPTITKLFDFPNYGSGPNGYCGLSGFGLDKNGELLICRMQASTNTPTNLSTGQIWKLIRNSNVVIGTPIPTDLAATGAFAKDGNNNLIIPLQPNPALIPYSVNAPLWSDQAIKTRWVVLPNSSGKTTGFDPTTEQVTFSATGSLTYPNGTVFVKQFALEDYAYADHLRKLETRFLVRSPPPANAVYGVTYKWNTAGTAATLIDSGFSETYAITLPDNSLVDRTWSYPSRDDCLSCHNANANHVLGPHTRQLNGIFSYPNGITDNQLSTWSHIGMFANPPSDGAIPGLPRMANIADASASIELRARSWLDANCSHCHRPGGVHAEFDAEFDISLPSQGLINGVVNNNLGITNAHVITPGSLSSSVLYQRDNSLTTGIKMPPLAKNLVDTQAMSVMQQWILGLTVGITAPLSGTVLTQNVPVTISASAGTTTSVDFIAFFDNGMLIGSDGIAPYSIIWTPSNLDLGVHALTAVVHDAAMATITSAPVSVTVTQPPTITLTAPTHGTLAQAPGTFVLAATASDPDNGVARVEFMRNGVVTATTTNSPYSATVSGLAQGSYTFSARVVDNVGATASSNSATVTVVGISGLTAEYWTNRPLHDLPAGTATLTRTEAGIDYDWGDGSPDPGISVDNFTARWTGTVTAPTTATYTFYATGDDGIRLWVNNVQLVDQWKNQGPTTYTGTYAMTAGQAMPLRMEYYENGGGAVARLEWSAAGVPRAAIPVSALSPPPVPPNVALTAPSTGTVGAPATVALTATASDSDGFITAVEFLQDGVSIATDTTVPYSASVAGLTPGTYVFAARATDSQGQITTSSTATVTVVKTAATVTLGNLAPTFDGLQKNASVTTAPPGLSYALVYSLAGFPASPINAGTYVVTATITDPSYDGTTTNNFIISPKPIQITLSNLVQTIDGQPKRVTVTTTPVAGLSVGEKYNGSLIAPSAIGTYTVIATLNEANYSSTEETATLELTSQPVISVDPVAIAEGNAGTSTATLTAALSTASTSTITVDWAASAGTASAGTDFTVASGTLTFAPGVTSQPITISVLGDTAFESNETVVVTLSNPSQVVIGTTTAVLTITNDDLNTAPVISEGAAVAATGDEDNAPTAFALTLHASDIDAGQTLTWSIIAAPSHGTLAPLGSGTAQLLSYAPTPNFNGSDSFTVRVSDGFAGTADCVVTVTVAPRNDAPVLITAPVVSLAAVSTATTGTWSDAADVTPGTITTAVQWQRADDASGTNVADLPGEITTSHTVTSADAGKFLRVRVTASDDGEGLPNTTSTIAYSAYVLLTSQPVVSIAPVSVAEGNAGTSTATLTATLSTASTAVITVDWATSAGTASAGTDFTVASGTLTFAPGVTSQPITISVLGDTAFESNETVVVTMSNPSQVVIGTTTAVLTITNDDANTAPVISEGAAVAAICDEDNAPTAFALTLHASDVDAGQTLTWSIISAPAHGTLAPLGSGTAQLISYAPTANFNGSDTFTVRVSDGFGGTADCVVTVTIAPRNDAPVLVTAPVVTFAAISTATTGTWSDTADITPGTITTAVQWQRADDASGTNVADLPGEITTSHTVTSADAGKFLRVRVTASDDGEGLPSTSSAIAYAAYVAVPAPSGTGSSSGGSPSGGGCGLGSGITGLLALVFLMLRRQRLH